MANYLFGQAVVSPSLVQYIAYKNLSANLNLEWASSFSSSPNVFGVITEVTTTAAISIFLPIATQVSTGQQGVIYNMNSGGSFSINVYNFDGNFLAEIEPGIAQLFYLADNTTEAGIWHSWTQGAGSTNVNPADIAGYGLYASSTNPSTLNVYYPSSALVGPNPVIGPTQHAALLTADITISSITLTTTPQFYCGINNIGSSIIPITATNSALINEQSSINLLPAQNAIFVCDGTNWYTLGLGSVPSSSNFTVAEVTIPSGATQFPIDASDLNATCIQIGGNLTANVTVFVNPVSQLWIFQNVTTGNFTVTLQYGYVTDPLGPSIPLEANQTKFCMGLATQDYMIVVPNIQDIINGGTGATTALQAYYNISGLEQPGDLIVGGPASPGFTTTPTRLAAPGPSLSGVLTSVNNSIVWLTPPDETNSYSVDSIQGSIVFNKISGQINLRKQSTFTTQLSVPPGNITNLDIPFFSDKIGSPLLVTINLLINPPVGGSGYVQLISSTGNYVFESFGGNYTVNDLFMVNLTLYDTPPSLGINYQINISNSAASPAPIYVNYAPSADIPSLPTGQSTFFVYESLQ